MTIAETKSEIVRLVNEANEVQQSADRAGRSLTAREQIVIDTSLSKYESLTAEVQRRERMENATAQLGTPQARKTGPGAITNISAPDVKSFGDFVRSGTRISNAAAMTVGGGADDGIATVPTVVSDQIREVQKDFGAVRQLATVMRTGQPVQVPIATTLPGAEWRVEADARQDKTVPVVKVATLPGGALSSVITVSTFLANDSAWNMENYIMGAIARAFGITEAAAFIAGTGEDGQVRGILDYTLAATADASRTWGQLEKLHTGSSGSGINADFILELSLKLDPSYRKNAVVIMNPATYQYVLSEKATGGGTYLLQAGQSAAFMPPLWGMPVFLDVNMPVPAADSASVIVGDLRSGYLIQDVGAMSVVRDPYTSKGNIKVWCESRLYAGVVDSNAIKVGVCSAD